MAATKRRQSNRRKKVKIEGDEFNGGRVERHVMGREDEKPARYHGPMPDKPGPTARSILADIKLRKQELEPVLEEQRVLLKVLGVLVSKDAMFDIPKYIQRHR